MSFKPMPKPKPAPKPKVKASDHTFSIYFTKEDRAALHKIKAAAKTAGLPLGRFCVQAILYAIANMK